MKCDTRIYEGKLLRQACQGAQACVVTIARQRSYLPGDYGRHENSSGAQRVSTHMGERAGHVEVGVADGGRAVAALSLCLAGAAAGAGAAGLRLRGFFHISLVLILTSRIMRTWIRNHRRMLRHVVSNANPTWSKPSFF